MSNLFSSVNLPKIGSNVFNLDHDVAMSFNMGQLVPTTCIEVVPGDKFTMSCENMIRFAPLNAPVFHKTKVTTHYFFVPNRILWPEWEDFITDNSDVELPYILQNSGASKTFAAKTLADYMGLSELGDDTIKINALPFAAYVKIWDEYYRAQYIQNERFVELDPGDNSSSYLDIAVGTPYLRAWRHDYFTSALPQAQQGDPVEIPVITSGIDVEYVPGVGNPVLHRKASDDSLITGITAAIQVNSSSQQMANGNLAYLDPNGTLQTAISAASTDITTLRMAFRMQEYLERLARAGSRYTEFTLSMFGVRSSDARLQRPEYIGGSKQNVVVSEVLATAQETAQTIPVGQMFGHGISVGGGNTFRYRAEEHGYIIGLINVQPDTQYLEMTPKHFLRQDSLDFYLPQFQHVGEQEILNVELYPADAATPEGTFGYIPRNAEHKYIPSRVAGDMKTTLNFWHMARSFSSLPTLSEAFIECDTDSINSRIFSVTTDDHHIWAHVFNNVTAVRKMARFGNPMM